jgi:hypothetical protein
MTYVLYARQGKVVAPESIKGIHQPTPEPHFQHSFTSYCISTFLLYFYIPQEGDAIFWKL